MANEVSSGNNNPVNQLDTVAGSTQQTTYTTTAQVVPAVSYGLTVGPETQIAYEQQQGRPIDGSNAWLRTLSPFTFRMIPPILYLENPDLLAGTETNAVDENGNLVPINLGIVSAAVSANSSFANGVDYQGSRFSDNLTGTITTTNVNGQTQDVVTTGGRSTKKPDSDETWEPAITDYDTAMDIAIQLEALLQTPPLTLLINPQSFAIAYNKLQQFSERSRHGYIFQAWGEDQPKLTINGKIGAFYAGAFEYIDTDGSNTTGEGTIPSGVQFASKRNSASFQNLMALFNFYKNNGYIYDTLGRSNAMLMVGCIAIDYDGWTYFGNLNSFNWGYEQALPNGGLTFDIDFSVVMMFDNRESTYAVEPMVSPTPSPSNFRYWGGPGTSGAVPLAGSTLTGTLNTQLPDFTGAFSQNATTGVGAGGGGGTSTLDLPTSDSGFEAPAVVVEEDISTPVPPYNTFIEGRR